MSNSKVNAKILVDKEKIASMLSALEAITCQFKLLSYNDDNTPLTLSSEQLLILNQLLSYAEMFVSSQDMQVSFEFMPVIKEIQELVIEAMKGEK